ncbi:glutamate receptor ionotropic, kainate 2 [Microplitis demolitor]|uniref:glutamate receptor ionotropic, kainate 2 n=1 Tax=Microplitis demolitor TaxID=69319 RepID=UPI00235B6996|nr:glutamate receptor ionotropic, kainate 2 [Microplitis demolitor]
MNFLSMDYREIIIIVITSVISSSSQRCSFDYRPLVLNLNNEYQTSGIIFTSSKNYSSFEWSTFVCNMVKNLSNEGILSGVIEFDELKEKIEFYQTRIIRPLVVYIIDEIQDVIMFEELSKTIDMNYPIWLLIFTGSSMSDSTCDYCQNIQNNKLSLTFSSEMIVWCCCNPKYLYEWWSNDGYNFSRGHYANWTYETGLQRINNNSLYAIRSSVDAPLRIAYVSNSVFFQYNNLKMGGFMGDILEELTTTLNIIPLMMSKNIFGTWNDEDKIWTGMVGTLWRHEADLGVGEVTMTKHRREILDFSLPLTLSPCRLYFKEPTASLKWSSYFEAFSDHIWMIIMILLMLTPVLLTFMKIQQKNKYITNIVIENYLNVWGIFCQQGLSEFPTRTSLRIAYFSMFISALVISAAYSAALISFLTVSTDNMPFNNLDEFIEDGTYKFLVLKDSADYDLFSYSNDSTTQSLKNLMETEELLPPSVYEGFFQVCIQKAAFYASDAMRMSMNDTFPCEITYIETGRYDSLAMILPLHSPYTGIFNHQIHRFRDKGILNRFVRKYFIKRNPKINAYDAVTIRGVAPILVVFTGGLTFAIILLLIERVIFFYGNDTSATTHSGSVTKIDVKPIEHSFTFKVKRQNNFINDNTKVNNK